MFAKKKEGSARRAAIIAALPVLVLCTAAAGAYVALADEAVAPPAVAPAPVIHSAADLEHAFWVCDYIATTHGVQAAPVALCSEVTAALQARKFGDDFGQMLEWWGRNKTTAHARLRSVQLAGHSIR